MTKDEALKLALDALETSMYPQQKQLQAITAIKEALAQPEQPKVRTGNCLSVGVCASEGHKIAPQRKPLTDEELSGFDVDPIEAKLMIAKLKEKNNG